MSEWTVETLREHLLALIEANDRRYAQRFDDSRTAVDAALSAAKEAVVKAEVAAEKRFEGVNEFRATLADQQRTLLPRVEAELRFDAMEKKLDELREGSIDRRGQKIGAAALWGWIAGAVGIALAVYSRFA